MKSSSIERQFYKLNAHGKLCLASTREYKKLQSAGLLLSFDDLTLPQRQEAKILAKNVENLLAKISKVQHLALELRGSGIRSD